MPPSTRRPCPGRRARCVALTTLTAALLLAACGGDEEEPTAVLTADPETATEGVATGTDATATASAGTGTAATATSEATGSASPATDASAGEPFDRAVADADYTVVGVAHDDVLNVRAAPGVEAPIVTELPPTGSATATGRARLLEGSGGWYELEGGGITGWANARYLALPGQVTDVTSEVVEARGGDLPQAETMLDLGEAVAATRASEEPASDVVMTVAPTVGDLGEVTLDVIGLGDDAIHGERLHVFGTPTEGGEGFVLKSVEMTLLCGRGVSDGLCV